MLKKSNGLSWKTGKSGSLNSISRLQNPLSASFFSVFDILKKSLTWIYLESIIVGKSNMIKGW